MRALLSVALLALLCGCATQAPVAPTTPGPVATPAPLAASPVAPAPAPPAAATAPQSTAIPDGPVAVWLVPLEGFPYAPVTALERRLSAELRLNVRATTHAGTNPQMYGANGQMLSEHVVRETAPALARLYDVTPKTVYIILTAADLNGADATTRFVFSMHFTQKISVASVARLSDAFYGRPDRPQVTAERLYKVVKKSIGQQYYELPRSTRLQSVMYSPIMSLDDLDATGTEF